MGATESGPHQRYQAMSVSNSEIWPAGQPVFAVMVSRTYRCVVVPNEAYAVLPDAGSNV